MSEEIRESAAAPEEQGGSPAVEAAVTPAGVKTPAEAAPQKKPRRRQRRKNTRQAAGAGAAAEQTAENAAPETEKKAAAPAEAKPAQKHIRAKQHPAPSRAAAPEKAAADARPQEKEEAPAPEKTAGQEPAAQKEKTTPAPAEAEPPVQAAPEQAPAPEPAAPAARAEDHAAAQADDDLAGTEAALQEGAQALWQDDVSDPEEADADPAGLAQELSPEQQAAEEARAAELTRTVQVSLRQVLENLPDERQEPAAEEPQEAAAEPENLGRRVAGAVGRGVSNIAKWLLLVVALVAVIAFAELAWLYHSATLDAAPRFQVSFAGQQLETAAYEWAVPVAGDHLKRTYKKTLSAAPQMLTTVWDATPACQITPSGYTTELTLADSAGNEVFAGSANDFKRFTFTADDSYTGRLVVSNNSLSAVGSNVMGQQTYLFNFRVQLKPMVSLNTRSVGQGGVVAVRVTGDAEAAAPVMTSEYHPELGEPEGPTELQNAAFVKSSSGWVAYLAIPYDQAPGDYDVIVTANGYEQTLALAVSGKSWGYKDYSYASQLSTPHIGEEEMPDEVRRLLSACDEEIGWADTGFVQPFVRSITVKLGYGTIEYVGRSGTQRVNNTGDGCGAVNTVVTTGWGADLISPAQGRVLLAEDLGGTAGKTVVIEHGAGLKSIFYGLSEIEVSKGQKVVQGQKLGTTGSTMICEVRIGTVAVDPFTIWRGQCDAIKLT